MLLSFQALSQIRFLNPQVFLLLLLLPLILMACRRRILHLQRARRSLGLHGFGAGKGMRSGRSLLFTLAYMLAFAFLLLALARPQLSYERETEVVRKLDVVFLLDTSLSMNAQDIFPSRLEKSRQVIRDLLASVPQLGRVGLVVFSGSSIILSYLTSDIGNILFYLDYLSHRPVEQLSTRIGPAIESGLEVVEEGRRSESANAGNRQVLILISDGEDHGVELTETLRQAQREGYPIYTVGIGSQTGGFIPLQRRDGAAEYLTGRQGARVVSRLNEGTLLRIAEMSKGRFFRVREEEELETAFREIVEMEREVIGFRRHTDWADLYRPVLAAALLFLLSGMLLAKE